MPACTCGSAPTSPKPAPCSSAPWPSTRAVLAPTTPIPPPASTISLSSCTPRATWTALVPSTSAPWPSAKPVLVPTTPTPPKASTTSPSSCTPRATWTALVPSTSAPCPSTKPAWAPTTPTPNGPVRGLWQYGRRLRINGSRITVDGWLVLLASFERSVAERAPSESGDDTTTNTLAGLRFRWLTKPPRPGRGRASGTATLQRSQRRSPLPPRRVRSPFAQDLRASFPGPFCRVAGGFRVPKLCFEHLFTYASGDADLGTGRPVPHPTDRGATGAVRRVAWHRPGRHPRGGGHRRALSPRRRRQGLESHAAGAAAATQGLWPAPRRLHPRCRVPAADTDTDTNT